MIIYLYNIMKKITTSFILLFFLVSCGQTPPILNKYYSTRIAEETQIDINENFVGYVQSDINTSLSSEIWGEILSMPVKVWQTLQRGDVIATINVDTSSVAYQWWESVVLSLQSMKQSIWESFDTQIAVAQSQLEEAKIQNQASQTALTDTSSIHERQNEAISSSLEVARESLEAVQAEKQQAENIFKTKEITLYSNAKNALTAIMIVDTNIMTFIDELFWITQENKYKNDEFYDFLWAKNITLKEKTKEKSILLYKDFQPLKIIFEEKINVSGTPDSQEVLDILEKTELYNDKLKSLLSDIYNVYDTSIESEPNFWLDILEQQKAKVSWFWQQIEQALISTSGDMLLWIKWTLQSLQSLSDEKQKTLVLLDKKIALATANLASAEKSADITPANQQAQIHQTQTNIQLTQQKLQQIQESIKSLEANKKARLAEIDSQITQTQAQTNIQKLSASKWLITSPISWVVTKKSADIGTVVWPWQQLVEVSDIGTKKIVIDVPQESLANLEIGQEASLLFDGEENFVNASITMIYPFQDEKTRKTRVEIRSEKIEKIPLGSRAKVYFKTQSWLGVTIPKNAILQSYIMPWVYVITNNKVMYKHIEIIDQNQDFAIIKWIPANSEIIVLWKENISDGESLEGYTKLPE